MEQNFLAAAGEQFQIDSEFAVHLAHERKSLLEPVVGALDLELHQLAKGGRVPPAGKIGFGHGKAAQVFERKIDAALCVIHANVLPKVGELQGGASVIGKLLALSIAVSAQVKDQMADGIGRVVAVSEDIAEGFKAGDGLILAEGRQQVGTFVFRNLKLADGFGQGHEYRMFRGAAVTSIEFGMPLIEQGEGG